MLQFGPLTTGNCYVPNPVHPRCPHQRLPSSLVAGHGKGNQPNCCHISDLRIRKKSCSESRAEVWELPTPVPAGLCCGCALGSLCSHVQDHPGSALTARVRAQGGTKHLHVFLPSNGNQSGGSGEEVKYPIGDGKSNKPTQ